MSVSHRSVTVSSTCSSTLAYMCALLAWTAARLPWLHSGLRLQTYRSTHTIAVCGLAAGPLSHVTLRRLRVTLACNSFAWGSLLNVTLCHLPVTLSLEGHSCMSLLHGHSMSLERLSALDARSVKISLCSGPTQPRLANFDKPLCSLSHLAPSCFG
jgi:hypothetical protein